MFSQVKYFKQKICSGCVDCDIGLFHKFQKPPYGGSNQFFIALKKELTRRNFSVRPNCINKNTKAAIINSFFFDSGLLRKLRQNGCKIIHRVVGPVSIYRGTSDDTDDRLQWEVNHEFADVTVFQSRYSLEAHKRMRVEFRAPVVIMNAVDPGIFYPAKKSRQLDKNKIKLIATSWSDNPNKGLDTYKWIDENLDWKRYHFTFVGRTTAAFKNIHIVPPVPSQRLADLIRKHDIYVTASLHDTCSNALLEGLACNLPAVYANSGGNAEIVQEAGFGFTRKEEIPGLLEQLVSEYFKRQKIISIPSINEVADQYLAVINSA
jgi:glycosyltransferase involved in cell wall biosynthesis